MKKNDLSKIIYDQKLVNKINKKITMLGEEKNITVYKFLNTRLILCIIIFITSLYLFKYGYIISPILVIMFYTLYEKIELDDKIKKRKETLETEAMHFFEILTLSLETGRNLEEALNATISNIDSTLSKEFSNAIRETKFGKSLKEALVDLQKKIPSENINNIILALTESNIYGTSIIDTLNNQVDYLREKRKLEIKAEISKIPIKVSIISVLFFIPLILLIILAPVLLSYIN